MDKKRGRELRRVDWQTVGGQVRENEQVLAEKTILETAQRIMKEVEDGSIGTDQIPLSHLYFTAPLENATGCDLVKSCGYKQTEVSPQTGLSQQCPQREHTHTHTKEASFLRVHVLSYIH